MFNKVQTFLDKLEQGCIWKRFYPGHFNPKWDVADSIAGGSCWQKAFATDDTMTVETICKKNGVRYEWESNSDSGGLTVGIKWKNIAKK